MGLPAAPLPRAIARQELFKGAALGTNSREKVGRGPTACTPASPDPTGMGHSDDSPAMARVGVGMQSWDGVLVKVTFQRDVAVGEGRLRSAEKAEGLCPATGPRKTE